MGTAARGVNGNSMNKQQLVALSFLSAAAALASPAVAQVRYGVGTAGGGGVIPQAACQQAWLGRADWGVSVTDGLGGSAALVGVALQGANAPVFGMNLLIDPSTLVASYGLPLDGAPGMPGDGSGFLSFSLAGVAPTPSLAGIEFYFQALVLDPSAPGLGGLVSASNGLRATITLPPELFIVTQTDYLRVDPSNPAATPVAVPFLGVNGAMWDNGGLDIYTVCAGTAGSPGTLMHGDFRLGGPVWTPINTNLGTSAAAWGNIAIQHQPRFGWIAGRGTGSTMEMLVLDLDPTSGTFGSTLVQTNGMQAALSPFGAWAMSPDGTRIAAASPWNGSLGILDTDPASSTFLQLLTVTPIPASSHSPGLTVNCYVDWSPDGQRVWLARQNQGTSPGDIACYDLGSGWVDFDPSTPWIVDHIGERSVPMVTLPVGLRCLEVTPDGGALCFVGSAFNVGSCGRLDLATLQIQYATVSVSLAEATLLDLNDDGDLLAVGTLNHAVLLDAATMTQIADIPLQSSATFGVEVKAFAWR